MANTKFGESTRFFSLCGNEIFLVFEQCSRTSTLDTIHNPFEGIFDARLKKKIVSEHKYTKNAKICIYLSNAKNYVHVCSIPCKYMPPTM